MLKIPKNHNPVAALCQQVFSINELAGCWQTYGG